MFDFQTLPAYVDGMSDRPEGQMAVLSEKQAPAFPETKIEQALGNWYDERMKTALRTPKSPEERKVSGGSVFDIQPELSSQQAVAVLLEMEEVLGFEPKKKVIRRGGYSSRGQFVKDLTARIASEYNERFSVKKPVASVVGVENEIHAQI